MITPMITPMMQESRLAFPCSIHPVASLGTVTGTMSRQNCVPTSSICSCDANPAPAGPSQFPRNSGQVRASSRYKDPHGRRKGRDANQADVVYIRAQVGAARGEIRYRQERYHATSLHRACAGSGVAYAGVGRIGSARQAYEFEEDEMKKISTISMTVIGLALWVPVQSHAQGSS